MKISRVPDGFYHAHIHVISNYKGDEIRRYFKQKFDVEYDFKENGETKFGTHFTVSNKDNSDVRHFICIQEFQWTVAQQALVIHEVFHMISDILRDIGIPHTKDTEEAYAFYLQYMIQRVLHFLLRDTGLLKKKK